MNARRIAVLVWLLLDLWRLWTPSLITIYGQAASTPPEQIGLFALAVMGAPLLVAPLGSRAVGPRALADIALGVALVTRILATFGGGWWQLVLASVGVVAAVTGLCLAAAWSGAGLWPGVWFGLFLATATHAALGTWGAVWRDDLWSWLLVVIMALMAWPWGRRRRDPTLGVTWPSALVVFPVLLLCGISLLDVGRASAVHAVAGPALTTLGAGLAWMLARADQQRPSLVTRVVAAVVLVLAVSALMLPEDTVQGVGGLLPWWSLAGVVVGPPALALLTRGAARPAARRTSVVAAAGAVLFTAVLFAFYAGYDLGYRADWAVVILAAAVALALAGPTGSAELPRPLNLASAAAPRWPSVVLAVVVALLAPGATLRAHGGPGEADGHLDVAAYNVRMGYGMDGTFEPDRVADQILASGADVVLLSEIDRGWLLNGGQDQLEILARLTGMEAVFAPAADQVWGDAVLTRWPVQDQWSQRFPTYDSLTGAEALTVVVEFLGQRVAVVATHLQPDDGGDDPTLRQAGDLAEVMERASAAAPYAVVGGDLNTTLDDSAWQVLLGAGFVDALADARPLRTSAPGEPAGSGEEIDHVLIGPGLVASDARAVDSELSDHLMVAVRLSFAS